MNSSLLTLVALSTALITTPAISRADGREGGNGGTVVVCHDPLDRGRITSVQLTDVYEALQRKLPPALGAAAIPPVDKVRAVIDALALRSPTRAALYRKWLDSFSTDADFVAQNKKFAVNPDTGSILIPDDCEIQWLVIYKDPSFPEDDQHLYHIIKSLWDRLDADNQAAAILHEIVYRELTTIAHHTTSERARYFNSYLFSGKLVGLAPGPFAQAHVRSQAGYVDLHGMLVQLQALDERFSSWNFRTAGSLEAEPKPTFFDDGTVHSGQVLNWDYTGRNYEPDTLTKLKSLVDGTERQDRSAGIRGAIEFPELSYYEAGGKRLAIGYVGRRGRGDLDGERIAFNRDGSPWTFTVGPFQPYFDADTEGFTVKATERSQFDLLYCGYGAHDVALNPDGSLWTFESTVCGVSPLTLESTSRTGELVRLELQSHNQGYPCGKFWVGTFGTSMEIDNTQGCATDVVHGSVDGREVQSARGLEADLSPPSFHEVTRWQGNWKGSLGP